MTADLTLVRTAADHQVHCGQLRTLADELLRAETEVRGPLSRAAHQLQDYAGLLEHADHQGWWDR